MADTITFRPDEDATRALAVLTKDGTSTSMAVRRRSSRPQAERRRRPFAPRPKISRRDEVDRAEAMQVLRDMETLRAW